jgi:hypothetical protein
LTDVEPRPGLAASPGYARSRQGPHLDGDGPCTPHKEQEGSSFLAGRQPLRLMTQAREAGDQVLLAFIVPNAQDDTRFRIDNRVPEDGHTIPDADLKRREPRILAHLPEAITQADLTAISISSTRSQDFTLEGAIDGAGVPLTPAVPPQVRTTVARRFGVRDVAVISNDHPVAGHFRAQITRSLGEGAEERRHLGHDQPAHNPVQARICLLLQFSNGPTSPVT